MKKLRILPLFLLFFLLLPSLLLSAAAAEAPSTANVDAISVINLEYGQTVFSFNENKNLYPASTAKLMTALVAEEAFSNDLDKEIEITDEMLSKVQGRYCGLVSGELVTIRSLLCLMLVGGYNDAAIALAFATAGDLESFCQRMNTYAARIGAENTHYTNPTGMDDPSMVTTARDTAYIGMAILQNETLFAMTNMAKFEMPATNKSEAWAMYSRNSLISAVGDGEKYYYSYADGIHAGETDKGGYCVVTSGTLDGLTYVCAVLGGHEVNGKNQAFITAKNALRHALVNFEKKTLKSHKAELGTLPVSYSATVTEVSYQPKEDLTALLPTEFNEKTDVVFETSLSVTELEAPFEGGTAVGRLYARDKNGRLLAQTELIVSESVEAHGFLLFMAGLKGFVLSPIFLILLLLAAGFVWFTMFRNKRPKKRRLDYHRR